MANRLHYSHIPEEHKPQFTEILSKDLVFFKQEDVQKVDIVKVNAEKGKATLITISSRRTDSRV